MVKINTKAAYIIIGLILLFLCQSLAIAQFPEYGTNPFTFSIPERISGYAFFVADIDGDTYPDFTYRSDTKLYVYNHYGTYQWEVSIGYPSIAKNHNGTKHGAADVDGDGQVEIVALDDNNQILIYNGLNGNLEKTYPFVVSTDQICTYIAIVNLRGAGDRDAIVQTVDIPGTEDQTRSYYFNRSIYAVNLETGQLLWQKLQDNSPYSGTTDPYEKIYEGYFGQGHGPFLAADIDLDGRDELLGGGLIEEDGTFVDVGYYDYWIKWVKQAPNFIDHIDAISVGDFRPDIPGLEWIFSSEDHNSGPVTVNDWHTVMLSKSGGVLWKKEIQLFNNTSQREPQNIVVADFDTTRAHCEVWNRSRFGGLQSHSEGLGQHPWIYNNQGNLISHYATGTTLPLGFSTSPNNGNSDGIELIWSIDWDGGAEEYIAAKARHQNGHFGLFHGMTGEPLWTSMDISPPIESTILYIADVAGDSREEMIIEDISSGSPVIKIFWNDSVNTNPKQSKWNDPLYKRLKQNWNYYSPGSYASAEEVIVTVTTDPPGLTFYLDGISYISPQTYTWQENTMHSINVPSPQSSGSNTRFNFQSWSDNGGRSHDIIANRSTTLNASFATQHYLNVISSHGNPQGGGWYNENTDADFSVTTPDEQNTTRYLFDQWSGDYSSNDSSGTITMNTPKEITANWDTQFYLTITSPYGNPQGSNWYDTNTTANFSITSPDIQGSTRYVFDSWSGDYSSTALTGSIFMDDPKAIQANWHPQHYLSTTEIPAQGGDMTPTPPGLWIDDGTTVPLTASSNPGYQFIRWTGAVTGNENPTSHVITQPEIVNATFGQNIQITINTDPPGLLFSADDSTYTAPKTFTWGEGSIHNISSITPQDSGSGVRYIFDAWSHGEDETHNFEVPSLNQTITVLYEKEYLLNITSSYGNPQGSGWHLQNKTVLFSITTPHVDDATRYLFREWTGDYTGTIPSGSTVMDRPKTILANWDTQFYLTVISSWGNPQGESWYPKDSTATFLVTSPDVHGLTRYNFSNWSGDYSSTDTSGAILMDTFKTVEAHWNTEYYFTAQENPDLGGDMIPAPPGQWFDLGTTIPVSATPSTGYQFIQWTGDLTSTENPTTIEMNGAKNVTAKFGKEVTITIDTNPSGLAFMVDDSTYTAQQAFTWIEGSSHSISAETIQSGGTDIQYQFSNWDNAGSQAQTYIVPQISSNLTAIYLTQYYLTINSDHGNPQGSDWYTTNSTANFSVTSPITTNKSRYILSNWSGDFSGTESSGSIIMDSPKEVTANWNTEHYLTLIASDHGSPQGEGWYLEGAQADFYMSSTIVVEGNGIRYKFLQWTGSGNGAYTGIDDTAAVIMNNPITEIAGWGIQYYLSTHSNPSWGGTVIPASPGEWYDMNHVASVTANPSSAAGYQFSNWTGDLSGSVNPTSLLINSPKTVTANFFLVDQIQIITDPSNLPITVDGVSYLSPQSFTWTSGTNHTIGVPSEYDYGNGTKVVFQSWSDGGPATHEITTVNDVTLYMAQFQIQHFLSTSVTPIGSGTIIPPTPGEWFIKGNTVLVQTTPETGFFFSGWGGDFSGTENPLTVIVDKAKSITSNFEGISSHIDEEKNQLPSDYKLFQNHPNPFNPETWIRIQLPKSEHVKLDVFNSRGRKIKTLIDGILPMGYHAIKWDGTDEHNQVSSSGIYIFIFKWRNSKEMKKGILMR